MICSSVTVLCEINMQLFSVCGVEVVSGAIELDECYIVPGEVQFGNVECFLNA